MIATRGGHCAPVAKLLKRGGAAQPIRDRMT